ncbi:putative bifunctional diguanylate cyclase/phosphodiesterase [Neptunomonas japonica]|uniref:putative bifunctional diguanylate cyclase/phosphodiesterase n=1 Tax=Neptunomonas japonica TaxID=417574 RepID=UPI00041B6C72|nr:bifunctional diguanylate cyclase/phosphodiesterase [Neptunomonas japonica]
MLTESSLDALRSLHNPIWVYDVELFKIRWANDQALLFWEADSEEELYHRDFKKNMSEAIYTLLSNNLVEYRHGHEHTQWWTLFPKNKRKEIYCHYSGIELSDGRMAMLAQVVVTRELLETELSLHLSTTTVSLWGAQGQLKSANPMFVDLYGESLSQFAELFFSKRQADEVWNKAFDNNEFEVEIFLPTPLGEQWHYLHLRVNQTVHGDVLVVRQFDVTERKQRELHHKYLAIVDPLTQLKNRYGVLQQLEGFAAKGLPFSLFFIDLDNFKTINDYYGHEQGDKLLRALADRLRFRFSRSLSIARLGGDEFLLVDACDVELEQVANQLINAVSEPFNLEVLGDLRITASIGIANFPSDGESVDAILRHADAAMYEAKGRGKSTFVYFSKNISNGIKRRHQMRQLLGKAISQHEFQIAYLPVVDTQTQMLFGVEAQLQWNSPELGVIKPLEFMPVAEENGMTSSLEYYALEKSCQQTEEWINITHGDFDALILMIDISVRQLSCHRFISSIRALLKANRMDPQRVMLQVTGSQHLDNELAIKGLIQLHEMGLKIALCGFASNNTSFTLLHRLSLTHLKLDAKIIAEIERGTGPIVKALLSMAKSMEIKVLAEGVARQEQLDILNELGCFICQGGMFGNFKETKNLKLPGLV